MRSRLIREPWLLPEFSSRCLGFLIAALLLAACGGGGGGGARNAAPTAQPGGNTALGATPTFSLHDIRVSPYAVWSDALASEVITVSARATSDDVVLQLTYFDELPGGTGDFITRAMFDDGSHGDPVAGDGVWTLSFTPGLPEPVALRLYDAKIDRIAISIRASDSNHNPISPSNAIDASVDLAVVSRSLEGQVTLEQANASVYTTDALVNIVDPGFDGQNIPLLAEQVYGVVPSDPFDFMIVFNTVTTGDGIPRSMGVKNDVAGINLSAYDHSAAYGSGGRLQQLVYQNNSLLGMEVNHEIGHRWGAFLNDPVLNLSIPTGFHWGPSDHVGQMGNGPYLLENAAGDYEVTNAEGSEHFVSNRFSNLELYVMGLIDASEVAPLRFVTDPAVEVRFGSTLPASSTRTVTIDDVVAVYGQRIPSAATSQNAFAAGFVVVSDQVLSTPEYTLSTAIARYYGGSHEGGQRSGGLFEVSDPPSFSAATGYRASLTTRLY